MPVYEYVCRACDERFEKYVRAWGEVVACPRCAGSEVEKQVSRFAFEMGDPKHLGHVLKAVRSVEGVYDVYRVTSAS